MSKIEDEYEKRHLRKLKAFNARVEQIYDHAIKRVSQSAAGAIMPASGFSLSKLPFLNNQVNDVIAQLRTNIEITIINGVNDAWELSNRKNNQIVDKRLTNRVKELPIAAQFYDANEEALRSFKARQVKGLGLSDRVWNSVKDYRKELEAGLALGVSQGTGAASMARELKQYLKDPDKLFRRVKDQNGVLQLSSAALNHHPGQGVYRSSFKNALRLTRTENNLAYRTADHLRWQSLPFVVGQEIRLSTAHPEYDICDVCAGRYPKGFVFTGWHPACLCYKVAIMMSDAEYNKYEDALLEGKTPRVRSANSVTDIPEGFKGFVQKNKSRIAGWNSPPYWVRDNFKHGDIENGLKLKTKPEPIKPTGRYTVTPESLQRLRATNVSVVNQADLTAAINSHMQGFDLEEIFSDLDKIGEDYGIEWLVKRVQGSKTGEIVGTRHVGVHKGGEVTIDRRFSVVNGKTEVYHALFVVPPSLQGGGLSKSVLGAFYKQYKNAGIQKVKVTANISVGGYAWAKYGFSATDPNEILGQIGQRRTRVTRRQFKYVTDMIKDHAEANPGVPFPMYKIANLGRANGTEYGKKLLMGTFWSGELDLASRKFKRIFEDYLYGKKKKTP